MASHYRFYAASNETVVPWNASYQFPSQANKAVKTTPRLVPKNGAVFVPGNMIRIECPATGYMNTMNSTFIMDVTLFYPTTVANSGVTLAYHVRFQQNIQSIFQRLRIIYGSTVLEDHLLYNTEVRMLTEHTAGNPHMCLDQSAFEGIGGTVIGTATDGKIGLVNVRQAYIQGVSLSFPTSANFTGGIGNGAVPYTVNPVMQAPSGFTGVTRRYQFQILAGMFQQPKLIPLKYMASQFVVEFTLENPQKCIVVDSVGSAVSTATYPPTYAVGNFVFLPEILEFDPSYDEGFLEGLYKDGCPIKFATWNAYQYSSALSSSVNLNIQERSRSVKAIFCLQQRAQADYTKDNGASFLDTAALTTATPSTLQQFQWRIGNRYFPGQPVQCSTTNGSGTSNGGIEAYLELQKALNIVGDYRLSTPCNPRRWGHQNANGVLQEFDYTQQFTSFDANGTPTATTVTSTTNAFSSDLGPQCFVMALNLETTNGVEISGLNAEEQSDIGLIAQWTAQQVTGADGVPSSLNVLVYVDALFLLKANNEGVLVK